MLHGTDEKWLASLPEDQYIPARDDKPELWPENILAVKCFGKLVTQRPVGMGVGAIPISEMLAFAKAKGIEDVDLLTDKLMAMDVVYMEWIREKQEKEASRATGPSIQHQ